LFSIYISLHTIFVLFFFNDTATTEIYTLSLHDALPILSKLIIRNGIIINNIDDLMKKLLDRECDFLLGHFKIFDKYELICNTNKDRKSTRLNSSHVKISYAVFCLKKKKKNKKNITIYKI